MTKEECMALLKRRKKDMDEERALFKDSDSWYDGIQRGIDMALEIIGMLGNGHNRIK